MSNHPAGAAHAQKVLTLDAAVARRGVARDAGERVVHCHGCFDIVHPGHVRHLQHARSLGDRLMVSITADAHIQKGEGRPLFDETLRAENLAALSCVDWVCVNPSPTAESLLERLRPDVYVKGQEYEFNEDARFAAERTAVERHGGRVVFTSGDVVFSSTALVEAMHAGAGAAQGRFEDPSAARLRQLSQTADVSLDTVRRTLASIRGRRVVIVGEPVIDTYVQCSWPSVGGESPVLSLRPVERRRYDGGAAVIARHCAALGARATLVTALPRDVAAERLRERLARDGVDVVSVASESPIAEKQRLMVGRDKLVKLDLTEAITLGASGQAELVGLAAEASGDADAAIVADYGLGMLTARAMGDLFAALRPRVGVLTGDVSGARSTLLSMRGADWLSPSEREMRGVLRDADASLPAAAWSLASRTDAKAVVVTMGGDGLIVFQPRATEDAPADGHASRLTGHHVPAMSRAAVDPLGCGDALLAAGTLSLASGAAVVTSAYIGSLAASREAQVLGNEPIAAGDVLRLAAAMDDARPVIGTVDRAARIAG